MNAIPSISVVIPTYNRRESLKRLLDTLERQRFKVDEVILAIAEPVEPYWSLKSAYSGLPIRIIQSARSVCIQRNAAIREANGDYILLCDDDMELPEEYIQRLIEFAASGEQLLAVSGLVLQRVEGQWAAWYPLNFRRLLFCFIFCHSVWFRVDSSTVKSIYKPLLNYLKNYYRKRGNTHTKAGWPLVTQTEGAVVRMEFYGIGAALIPRKWLLESPYDESLHLNGYGDNYGVALGFPGQLPIAILLNNPVYHHQDQSNRIPYADVWYYRTKALYKFIKENKKFRWYNRLAFAWSVLGSMIQNPRLLVPGFKIYAYLFKYLGH